MKSGTGTIARCWVGKIATALAAAAVALAIAGVAGEWAVRYRERHRTTVPGTMPLLFYRHSRMVHALVRDYDYFG